MSTELLFQTHLVLGYVAWLLCFDAYILPRLRSMDRVAAHALSLLCTASAFSGSSSSFRVL